MRYAIATVLAVCLLAGCEKAPEGGGVVCFGDGLCQLPDGRYIDGDGDTPCAIDNSCPPTDTAGDPGPGDVDPGDATPPPTCDTTGTDSDGDGISNDCEDRDGDNVVDSSETNPNDSDTDNDCIPDGLEDANHNGQRDPGETNATRTDSDGDGIPDGGAAGEDKNCNGLVGAYGEQGSQCDGVAQGACLSLLLCRWNNTCAPKLGACYESGLDTAGESNPRLIDSDLDGIPDNVEDRNLNGACDPGETCLWYTDSDCDGLPDGKEDLDGNGVLNTGETDPYNPDTDSDGLIDGIEDANRNGRWDSATETSARLSDSDGDGIRDGVEDRNQDGVVQSFVDTNGNGCWDEGETQGESDPRRLDSDGDNIDDRQEDNDRDGFCAASSVLDPFGSGQMVWTYQETCAFLADTDCDGLRDGHEDVNRNGLREVGELDAKRSDTDLDGLADGCRPNVTLCEDANNDGVVDAGETNPLAYDTDGDLLGDGCEPAFQPAACDQFCMDPLSDDSDGDGIADGDEDTNHNCAFEPGLGETDPRVPGQTCTDPISCARYEVCGAQNLKPITFATSNRLTHDYRLAFEVELDALGNAREYLVQPFGKDLTGDVFVADDPGDAFWGVVFQAPDNVYDAAATSILSRDAYGFLLVSTTDTVKDLNVILDEVRADLAADPSFAIETALRETPRPTHDNLPNFSILRAQDELTLTLTAKDKAVKVRKDILNILLARYFGGRTPEPANVPPDTDPFYERTSSINCPQASRCYDRYSLSIAAVQRVGRDCTPYGDQSSCDAVAGCQWTGTCLPSARVTQNTTTTQLANDPLGQPAVILIVALTPDDAATGPTQFQRHADRKERLEDLTGGSALARFAAAVSKSCEGKPARDATADILWVVDDSLSMQQVIGRLQRAATDARDVLTASAAVVDFRTAMTTTNNSLAARTQCLVTATPGECNASCGPTTNATCNRDCADQSVGCLTSTALANILADADNPTQAAVPGNDLARYPMPGGGGTFYFEDSEYLDCIAKAGDAGQQLTAGCPVGESCTAGVCSGGGPCNARFLNTCAKYADAAEPFEPFFGATRARKRLLANAGFLRSTGDACVSAAMDLLYDVSATQPTACLNDPDRYCERLSAACTDGPSVLASQMCDLIRAMGGLPCQLAAGQSSSSRRHSAPEYGTRAARQLLDKLTPAFPGDSPDPTAKLHLRLDCKLASSGRACSTDPDCDNDERCTGNSCVATGNCRNCDPGQVLAPARGAAACTTEAECWAGERCDNPTAQPNAGACRWDCRVAPLVTVFLSDEEDFYLKDDCRDDARSADKAALPVDCRYVDGDPTDAEPCTLAYCSAGGLRTGIPAGHNPDLMAQSADASYSQQWRTVPAPAGSACSAAYADRAVSCVGDPCPYQANSTDCTTGAYGNICVWSGTCRHTCTGRNEASCTGASQCRWERGLVLEGGGTSEACVPAYPLNDCQPCKRFLRTQAAVAGSDGLVGFGELGPVYAIVRDAGVQGYGAYAGASLVDQDPCNGGGSTWGRGDGQTYRDLATLTQGVTTNVCTSSSQGYAPFMQRLVNDIASLSAPYRLARSPISATLKVGIARPGGTPSATCTDTVGGGYVYCPVPRSRTSGFFYDPSTNSLGFAVPATGSVPDYLPQEGDTVFVSYRYWLDVPCREECGPDETCLRLFCPETTSVISCGTTPDCPALGQQCENNECVYPCVPGEFLDICICGRCGSCETCDLATGACTFTNTDPCVCNPRGDVCEAIVDPGTCNSVSDCLWSSGTSTCELGAACDPSTINTCQPGFFCNDSCVCERASCSAGFNPDGTVSNCQNALTCCNQWAAANDPATGCATISPMTSANCTDNTPPRCVWTGTTCEPEAPACCLPGETPECYTDPEVGQQYIICRTSSSCVCEGNVNTCDSVAMTGACGCSGNGDCESWQTCDIAGSGLCTPACNPQLEECRVEAGACRCLPIPP